MMNENFLWQTLQDPLMLQSFQRCHSIDRVPIQTQVNKLEEFAVLTLFEYILESLSIG